MISKTPRVCLVTCQGSTQLAAVVGVLKQRANFGRASDLYHLVVFGLYAPEKKSAESFFKRIASLARKLFRWESITYLSDETLAQFSLALEVTSPNRFFESVKTQLGIEQVDEILVGRNWLFGNELLLNTYRRAEKICYGDGVGFYFSKHYALPSGSLRSGYFEETFGGISVRPGLRGAWQQVRKKIETRFGLRTQLAPVDCDSGYFLLPNPFGEEAAYPWELVDKKSLRKVFGDMAPEDPFAAISGPIMVILTSNFSESRQMETAAEIGAYLTFLDECAETIGTTLLVKGHPRENPEKRERLVRELRNRFSQVLTFEDPHLPIEAWLELRCRKNQGNWPSHIRVVSFGATALSLIHLFGAEPVIGFGEKLAKETFHPDYAPRRIQYETDLRKQIGALRSDRSGDFVASASSTQ